MGIQIKVTSHLGEFMTALDTQVEATLEAIGGQAEGHAKVELERSPNRVDTGLLRNSITYALDGKPPAIGAYSGAEYHTKGPNAGKPAYGPHEGSYSGSAPQSSKTHRSVYVGTNVEYAIYVHDGTKHMAANRFLKNAITNNSAEYEAIAKLHLEG